MSVLRVRQRWLFLYVEEFATKEANIAAADLVEERYRNQLEQALPPRTTSVWDRPGSGHRKPIRFELQDEGYLKGNAAAAAERVVATCHSFLKVFSGSAPAELMSEMGRLTSEVNDE